MSNPYSDTRIYNSPLTTLQFKELVNQWVVGVPNYQLVERLNSLLQETNIRIDHSIAQSVGSVDYNVVVTGAGTLPTAKVWATGAGVAITQNTTTGEFTIAVPLNVELKSIVLPFHSSDCNDANGHLFVTLDITGNRLYNNTMANVKLPIVRLLNNQASPSDTFPVNVVNGGGATNDKQYGVAGIGGGDGSDLRIRISSAAIATSNILILTFP